MNFKKITHAKLLAQQLSIPLPHIAVDRVLIFDTGAIYHPQLKRIIRKVIMDLDKAGC